MLGSGIYKTNGYVQSLEFSGLDEPGAYDYVKDVLCGARLQVLGGEVFGLENVDLFVDENGLMKGLEQSPFFQGIFGDVVILPRNFEMYSDDDDDDDDDN